MRKPLYAMPEAEALALFRASPTLHLATTTPEGSPVLRVVHGVVLEDGSITYHGGRKGEKASCLGREAVLSVEQAVATIPSTVFDPELACPATTYYRSAQVHGRLEEIEAPAARAAALQALMERLQPEGGYAPITADDPRYARTLAGLHIIRVVPTRVSGKAKLGQNRRPEQVQEVMAFLWRRGLPGDPEAIVHVQRANPAAAPPAALQGPAGLRLLPWLDARQRAAALELVAGVDWTRDATRAELAAALASSSALVGVEEAATGRLIATARAISDGTRHAWIYDVVVEASWRQRGVGEALMGLLLEHPAVRQAREVRLTTRDAEGFYERLGFARREALRYRPWRSVEMTLHQGREAWFGRVGDESTAEEVSR